MDKAYNKCLLCGESSVQPSHFWKEHRVKEADYCTQNYPRFSKLTKDRIVFKNRNQYFESDFNNKNELKKWIKENPDTCLDYCLSLLERRYTTGKAIYSLSQVETRTLCIPSVAWYNSTCNYNVECESLGFKTRFRYLVEPVAKRAAPVKMQVDTREQKPLVFDSAVRQTLKYADYASELNPRVFVERKSLSDFISTLSSGYERFQREIDRAQVDNNYIFVAVESDLTPALSFEYLPQISRKIKASSDFVFHRVRELMQKYNNIQFVFLENRKQMVEFIKKLYLTKEPELYDWQFLLDTKKIVL